MIRITRETDFAILLLAEMEQHADRPIHTARDTAGWIGISVPMASKVLKALSRSGLVTSNRGPKGGYRLARALDKIAIADVVRAIEGPISLVECVAHPGLCGQEPSCLTSRNWKRINQAVEQALASVTVSQLVHPTPPALLQLGAASGRGG